MRANAARGQPAELVDAANGVLQRVVRDGAGAMRVDIERQRRGHADGVAELDGAARGKTRRDDVLGQVAADICRAAIDLRGILAAERAAAVRGRAAIGVDDDLATRQPGVTVWPADHEAARRVDVPGGFVRQEAVWKNVGDHALDVALERRLFLALVVAFGVLGGNHHGSAGHWLAVAIAQRHLALGVGFEERRSARFAVLCHAVQDLVAVIERSGHQIVGFVAGETEHDALVARAFVLVAAGIDALRDVRALAVQVVLEGQRFPVKAVLLVTDFAHGAADDLFDLFECAIDPVTVLEHALATDLTGEHHALRRRQRFAGDARFGILGEEQVDHGVGNLVGDLVRVALGHAFGSEQVIGTHINPSRWRVL